MAIVTYPDGMQVITGEHVRLASLLALKGALKLEIAGLRRRGKSAATIAREVLNSSTLRREKLLEELERYIGDQYGKPEESVR